jgi:hypothetical protein
MLRCFSSAYKPLIVQANNAACFVLRQVAERRTISTPLTVAGVLRYVTVFTRVTMEM